MTQDEMELEPPYVQGPLEKVCDVYLGDSGARARLLERLHSVAMIKQRSPSTYEKLRLEWKKAGIERLAALDAEVTAYIKRMTAQLQKSREDTGDGFERDGNGTIAGTPDNIRHGIKKAGVCLRYDEFRGQAIIENLAGYGPALDDAALRRLRFTLSEQFGFLPSRDLFEQVAFDECWQVRFHPVRDLLGWYQCCWDGESRLDTWLIKYAGAKDTPFVRAVSRIVLLAAVRRVRQPGVKFDEMLVLESAEQGLNKSSLVAALALRDEWFTDSVPLNADDKTMIERLAGHWICEVGELQGMRKGEIERIRAQLSRGTDRARLAYARLPSDVPRQSVLIGTTNATSDAPYLADINGNRRFWPVEVGRCDVAGFIRDREQIWGEAAALEARGESIRLPETLWEAAGQEQNERAVGNAFTDVLAPLLDGWEGTIRSDDVWRLVHIPVERRDAQAAKLGNAMRSLGWTRKQKRFGGGTRVPCYIRGTESTLLTVDDDLVTRGAMRVVVQGAGPANAGDTNDY